MSYVLELGDWADSTVIHQAVGMICVQGHCTIPEAFARLTRRAKADGLPVHSIAITVITHRIDFYVTRQLGASPSPSLTAGEASKSLPFDGDGRDKRRWF
jgi:hypothetical protein